MNELFLSILNAAITAGWLVLAVLLARLVLKKAPAWVRCAMWAIVALRLIWPYEIKSSFSLVPSTQTLPPEELYTYTPQLHTSLDAVNSVVNPAFTQVFASDPANSVNPLQVATEIAGWIWVAGMVAMLIYSAVSYARVRRRVRVSMPVEKNVYLSDGVASPFILGFFRPKIYLPSCLEEEKWDVILRHERAHLARKDHWWKPLGYLLLTVFWFHPLLWLAYILLCRDMELACDEKVIEKLSAEEKQAYSNILLECSMPKRWVAACPLAFGEGNVKGRIKAVLHYKKPALWIIIAALIVSGILAACFLTEKNDDAKSENIAMTVAGKAYVRETDGQYGSFTITIAENGTFSYSESMNSSHLGHGNWEVKDRKLYLYDKGRSEIMTFVFKVESDALVFLAKESDAFIYTDVENGERFDYYKDTSYAPSQLIYVRVKETREEDFLAVDIQGNTWCIRYTPDQFFILPEQGWVNFVGEPEMDEAGVYHIKASAYWDYRCSVDEEQAFDACAFDVDGDGTEEFCYIIAEEEWPYPWMSVQHIRATNYKLIVRESDETEYEVVLTSVTEYLGLADIHMFIDDSPRNVRGLAFAVQDGKLVVVSACEWDTIPLLDYAIYDISFSDGELMAQLQNDTQ